MMIAVHRTARLAAAAGGVVLSLGFPVTPLRAEALAPVTTAAEGTLAVTRERRLVVEGITGDVSVRLGLPNELRFASARIDEPRQPLKVAVYAKGTSLYLKPPSEGSNSPRRLQIGVPSNMSVLVEQSGGTVRASALRSPLEIRGAGLEVDLKRLSGSVELDLSRSRVEGTDVGGDLSARAEDVDLVVEKVGGAVDLNWHGGKVKLNNVVGGLDLDLNATNLSVANSSGVVRLTARAGDARLSGLQNGGELKLSGSPLVLSNSGGDVRIDTDSDVSFTDTRASLHIDNYGGLVRGSGNTGPLGIKAQDADVIVRNIQGPMRLEGRGLKVILGDIAGKLHVETIASDVQLEKLSAEAVVNSEFGNVTIRRATNHLRIRSVDGDVRVLNHSGSVDVDASGPEVEVSWLSLGKDRDSSIENDTGNVTLRFPPRGGGRIEARTRHGRIDSAFPGVRIGGDGASAAGILDRARGPTVHVKSRGDIFLTVMEK